MAIVPKHFKSLQKNENKITPNIIMTKKTFILTVLLIASFQSIGQHLAITFQEAQKQGVIIKQLDSIYQSALDIDTTKAVFKTELMQDSMQNEYIKLLQNFGNHLSKNNFIWTKPTRCFNRIYFNTDGTIDYFLFNFLGNSEDKPSKEKQEKFQKLLNIFITDYKIGITAPRKFAQCSPTTYMPQVSK